MLEVSYWLKPGKKNHSSLSAAFIDPFFSSGVHLASAGGLTAAASICAVRKGEINEEQAAAWHTARSETAYTR